MAKLEISFVLPERFKRPAAHFPIQHDGRTSMQRATLGKSSPDEVNYCLYGRIAGVFCSNSLVKTMEMTHFI